MSGFLRLEASQKSPKIFKGCHQGMSGKGNCYDNAPMESFFGTLEIEVDQDDLEKMSRAKVRTMLFDYIEVFYNRQRAHSSLGFLSPVDFENALSTT